MAIKFMFAILPPHVEDECASVCGLIWLAGDPRLVVKTAHIGFHAARYASNGKVLSDANAVIGAYLFRLGFSYDTIRFLTHTSPDSMEWLTNEAAEQFGITAQVLSPLKANRADVKNSGPWETPPWLLYIPAIVMGIFTLGFIRKTIG